jgi:hypothetical protein
MSLTDRLINFATKPVSYRQLFLRNLLRQWHIGSYKARLHAGGVHRPNYGWCTYYAAALAKALGHKAVTVVEMGVAGGNGLVCLCDNRRQIEKELGIEILVAGFDTGSGLPASTDYRDFLYAWPAGSFVMDRGALERRIGDQAKLVLGDVATSVANWQPDPQAPLGAVMFDLDYFSSTVNALPILTKENSLPRVWCYFDDVCTGPEEVTTEGLGEHEAIRLFNLAPERERLKDHVSRAYSFKGRMPEPWHQHIYIYHRFNHPDYNVCITANRDQLNLRNA